MADSMIESMTQGKLRQDARIARVARHLATIENNLYWKYNFPEGHKTETEKWYMKRAKEWVEVFDILMDEKK
jgi:hypothetical protein